LRSGRTVPLARRARHRASRPPPWKTPPLDGSRPAVQLQSIRRLCSSCHRSLSNPIHRVLLPCCCWCVLPVRLVFLSVSPASAERDLRGTRDTTPGLCSASFLLLAAAAPALGFDGASCGNSTHRVEPIPKARGCAGCARGQMTTVGERAEGRTALRGCTV
jgi:hypothetical protein